MLDTIHIELLQDIELRGMYGHALPHKYSKGMVVKVIYASNLPVESEILFWIAQDGWQDDSYGFPIYKDTDYVFSV